MRRLGVIGQAAEAFFGRIEDDCIDWRTARFADATQERAYNLHLVAYELPKERFVNFLGVALYLAFGALDLVAFSENLSAVLILRWGVCAPIAFAIIALTFLDPFKQRFQYVSIAVMWIGSMSIVAMIAMLPPSGGAPYIIGTMTIFIFFACIQRMYFVLAAISFITVAAAYAATITVISPKTGIEQVSGLFFMSMITLLALATSYTQEIRSRLLYFRHRQRALDQAYIEQLLIEATAADQSKLNFLSILSHELRTPLHQIIGFCEVMMRNRSDKADRAADDYMDDIYASANSLLGQIAKMLRYADATAGKMRYEIENCPARELAETVEQQNAAAARKRNVSVGLRDIEDATLHIDPFNTAYAVGHLLENAINATPSGGVVYVDGRIIGDGAAYEIVVSDSGEGMSPEKLEAAFKPFTQIENARTRSREGVGLGLTLARRILNDQQADLTLESTLGVGTRARAVFPLTTALQSPAAA